ncbi:MAG: hypothetical protein KF878_37670 [Planctomycetes bacterium]|nr:hypothetical protein [Planctomycetota bacterium]
MRGAQGAQVVQRRARPVGPARGVALARPAALDERLPARAPDDLAVLAEADPRRRALHGLEEQRLEAVRERPPHRERLALDLDARPRRHALEARDRLAHRLEMHQRRGHLRPRLGRRVEAQARQERPQRVEDLAGEVAVAVLDQPGDDEQRALLGHVDAIAPVPEPRLQTGEPLVAEVPGVQRRAGARVARQPELRQEGVLVRQERPLRQERAGGEAAAQHLERGPRRRVRHRGARAHAQRAREHALVDARPRPGARAAARQRPGELAERVPGVRLGPSVFHGSPPARRVRRGRARGSTLSTSSGLGARPRAPRVAARAAGARAARPTRRPALDALGPAQAAQASSWSGTALLLDDEATPGPERAGRTKGEHACRWWRVG